MTLQMAHIVMRHTNLCPMIKTTTLRLPLFVMIIPIIFDATHIVPHATIYNVQQLAYV